MRRRKSIKKFVSEVKVLVGRKYIGHSDEANSKVKVIDSIYPITEGINDFEIIDEIYKLEYKPNSFQILITSEVQGIVFSIGLS